MRVGLAVGVLAVGLSGCAYKVQPDTARISNVHSSYDDKVPGRFALVLDYSVREVHRVVTPVGEICAAHSYPIDMGDTLSVSVSHAMQQTFEYVVQMEVSPSVETMLKDGFRGVAVVKLEDFRPRLMCSQGFWSGTCSGSTDIGFSVSVRGTAGQLFATSAGGSKTADHGSLQGCAGAANAMGESITRATRDALERLAERMANSPRLRGEKTATGQ